MSLDQESDTAAGSSQGHSYIPETLSGVDPKDQLFDFSNFMTANSSPLTSSLGTTMTYFSTPSSEQVVAPLDLCGVVNSDGGTIADMDSVWARQIEAGGLNTLPSPPRDECTCHEGVTELLVSIRQSSEDQKLSLDAQLAKLKRCMLSSETSMGCPHGKKDSEPIHIMVVITLIGYVVDQFERLASEAKSPIRRISARAPGETDAIGNTATGKSSMSTMIAIDADMSAPDVLEPRLSWGVLELEDDDERDLRQRLYFLSFRKLERLLSQMTLYLRNLHDARASVRNSSRHMAFVVACDYMRLWLEKKAGDVKRLFSVAARDGNSDAYTQLVGL